MTVGESQSPRTRSSTRSGFLLGLVLLVGLAAAGAIAGVLWELLWTPPSGVAIDGQWVLDPDGVPQDFAGTGIYVLVGLVIAILVGITATFLSRRRELIVLVVGVAGSVLAAWVAVKVGQMIGPPDPATAAESAADYTAIDSDLQVRGWSPYLAWPIGFTLGTLAMLLVPTGSAHVGDHSESPRAKPGHRK